METIVREADTSIENAILIRNLSEEEFIEKHGSGTLRKNKRIGFSYKKQYLHERVCYEFGPIWECMPRTYITFGDAITEGDCHAITEAGYYAERYIEKNIFKDRFQVKYIQVENPDGSKIEGIGLICRETSAKFIPSGHLLFCIIAEFDVKNKVFLEAKNPS